MKLSLKAGYWKGWDVFALSFSLSLTHTCRCLLNITEAFWGLTKLHLISSGFGFSPVQTRNMQNSTENKEQWKQEPKLYFYKHQFFLTFFFLRSDPEVKVLLLEDTSHISPHMHTLKDDSLRLSYASTFTALTSSRNKNIWLYFLNIFFKYTNLSLKKKTQKSPNCSIISSVKKANKSLSQNSLYFLWKNYHF